VRELMLLIVDVPSWDASAAAGVLAVRSR